MTVLDLISEEIKINEMAAGQMTNDVIKKVKAGDVKGAAEEYLDNHVNKKYSNKADTLANKLKLASAKAKQGKKIDNLPASFKADKDLLKDIPLANWDGFAKEYQELVKSKGVQKERKGGSRAVSSEGDIKTQGQTQSTIQKNLMNSINKALSDAKNLLNLAEKNEKILDKVEDYSSVDEIESNIEALIKFKEAYNRSLEAGKPLKVDKGEKAKERLEKIYNKIKEKAKDNPEILKKIERIEDEKRAKRRATDKKEREEWLKSRELKDPAGERAKKEVDDELERKEKEREGKIRSDMERGLEALGGKDGSKARKKRKIIDKHKKWKEKQKKLGTNESTNERIELLKKELLENCGATLNETKEVQKVFSDKKLTQMNKIVKDWKGKGNMYSKKNLNKIKKKLIDELGMDETKVEDAGGWKRVISVAWDYA